MFDPHKVYERHGIIPVAELLPRLQSCVAKESKALLVLGSQIKIDKKLRIFAASDLTCRWCGLSAQYFAVECVRPKPELKKKAKPKKDKKSQKIRRKCHLNLYAVRDGKEEQFTLDHIIPKARGGTSDYDNLQIMCHSCNSRKSDRLEIIDAAGKVTLGATRTQLYSRIGVVPFEDLMPVIFANFRGKIEVLGHTVGLRSQRLMLILHAAIVSAIDQSCVEVKCGTCYLRAKYFALEKIIHKDTPKHEQVCLNLYGIRADGTEELFGKDYRIPPAQGGEKQLYNLEIICASCKNKKANNYRFFEDSDVRL